MNALAMGAGASEGLDRYLERMLEEAKLKQIGELTRSSQAETSRHNMADEAATSEYHKALIQDRNATERARQQNWEAEDQARKTTAGRALGESIPADTFLPETDPAVGMMQKGGVGSMLRPQEERPAVPEGPLMPGDTGEARLKGFRKQPSTTQSDKATDNTRQGEQQTETVRHDKAMEEAALLNAKRPRGGGSAASMTEPVVNVQDPETGAVVPVPRSIAANPLKAREFVKQYTSAGLGNRTSPQREKIAAYQTTLSLLDDIERVGEKTKWNGVGPIAGRLGGKAMELVGYGDPEDEHLRNLISQLKAAASFQEGGKQFTGTEREMLEAFLAGITQNPQAAIQRLHSFREQATRSLAGLGHTEGGTPAAPSGGGKPGAKVTRYDINGNVIK